MRQGRALRKATPATNAQAAVTRERGFHACGKAPLQKATCSDAVTCHLVEARKAAKALVARVGGKDFWVY